MSLTNDQLIVLRDVAKEAALEAGKIISSRKGSDLVINDKVGGENLASCVVTEIDLAAEKAILKILTPTLERFNLGLLTEESTDDNSRFVHDFFWCIDPLDGTLCYSRDEDGYSVSIALISKTGTPTIGVVYNPKHDSLYSAIKDHGTYKNGSKLKVNTDKNELTLLYDQSYLKYPLFQEQIDQIERSAKESGLKGVKLFHLGGAVMNGITTIEMAPALYFKFPKKSDGGGSIWDFAASSVIQSEAGGFNSNYHLQPLDLNRKESTFMNHEGAIYTSNKSLLKYIPKI